MTKIKGIKVSNTPGRLYMAHVMNVFTGFSDDVEAYVQGMEDDGYNVLWLYRDDYYDAEALPFLDAAANVGMKVIVGNASKAATQNTSDMIEDTIAHPAIYKYKGKPVFSGYDYTGEFDGVAFPVPAGVTRSDFYYWVSTRYPYYISNAWQYFVSSVAQFGVPQAIEQYFDTFDEIDGIINFAVDKPSGATTPLENIIRENTYLGAGARSRNKVAIGGTNNIYASAQFEDYGFEGTLSQVKEILALDIADWPLGISDTTANDYAERSNMSRSVILPTAGLSFIPELAATFNLGDTTPYPAIDGSGIQKFMRPWIEKFKASDQSPVVITEDKIFCWYSLHPREAAFITTVPAYLSANRPATVNGMTLQEWWNGTIYHGPVGRPSHRGDDLIDGIKAFMPSTYDDIQMAAHLVTSGYLRIVINGNTYTSSLMPAGDAYYQVAQELGTPVFSIIDADGTTVRKTGTGPQAITNNCWPGGWKPLIQEL